MKLSLPRRVFFGFAAALLAVVAGAFASFQSLRVRQENLAAVTHAMATLNALERLIDVLRDAETGQRGFLLTGDERYLKPYYSALKEEDSTLATFRELARGNPALEQRLPGMAWLIQQKLGDLRLTVEIARSQGRGAALAVVRGDVGLIQMERIREESAALESIERTRLEERQRAWTRSIFVSNTVLAGSSLLLLLIIIAAANEVRRELREREAREVERVRLVQMQQQLMGIVGHDLRSPLSAVIASGELLARASDLPPGRQRAALRIIQSGKRMERMIRDLLDYARAQMEGKLPIRPRSTDLSEICRHVVEELEADHPGRKIERVHRGEATGDWDPDRLAQVISNLVSNALRYGAANAPVSLSTQGVGEVVSIEVHNQGEPIPADRLPQLFQPFKRGSESVDGIGLGLFIVHTLVEGHGGRITVHSVPGEGTTFRVELPRRNLGAGRPSDQYSSHWPAGLSRPASV